MTVQSASTAPTASHGYGFSISTRAWVTDAPPSDDIDPVPTLDGDLVLDAEARARVSTDLGAIVRCEPSAILRPGSTEDIAAMVRFCARHDIGVSVRGQAHTTLGQTLGDGLVIENRHLSRIHEIGLDSAEVDAGATWKELLKRTADIGLTPPVLTGYCDLSIGGTLSVGGIGGLVGGLHTGLQVDHVLELEIVTGTGDVVRCSADREADLFRAALGGLGRVGIITRVVIPLVKAPERARTYTMQYAETAPFFADLGTLTERDGIDHVYGEMFRTDDATLFLLHATSFYDPPTVPDDVALGTGLSADPKIDDRAYLEHTFLIDEAVDGFIDDVGWTSMVKPWFDVWLPGSTAETCVEEIMKSVSPEDIGPYGAGLLYPQRRSLTGMPTPRLPDPDGSDWVFVLDLNTVSASTTPEEGFAERMLERNRRMFARARDAYGARLYPIGSVPFGEKDWRDHYGAEWETVQASRAKFNPRGTITSGRQFIA
ncbi:MULTISPECIES: FAD-binding protein [unclassified Dermacoccus]|uniref:FAD-binding protein n=1 Tax=unclassified Dermacoccus TaxID=2643059 RepID=UPI0009E1BD0C|nr:MULTISPECIES: FAD-binding protein [unclassified Dermacoccus]